MYRRRQSAGIHKTPPTASAAPYPPPAAVPSLPLPAVNASPGEVAEVRTAVSRWLWFALGWLFFGLGAARVVLPLLPTTPLMLLALWAFSKSSQRFRSWLFNHRVFGKGARNWHENRVIPARAKALAITTMVASLTYLGFFSAAPWWGVACAAALMASGALFISRCPSTPPQPPQAS